ncbi:hypothetical protein G4X40_18490 [Rhodococcus sp. D2-41]|uniref:hypothetical protein n=1 Tax=Speluncibacter jeojiensis TaxID=2710754 RepID=UPI00240F2078|nr:hypothetical protein [Rhodococcus sp. D2-41]MDG3012134.1 hypothetical protein [Rhodococcus sp. D2-41]
MTTPGGSAPDGAWVVGSRYGQDITEASAKAAMKTPVLDSWGQAQNNFRAKQGEFRSKVAEMKDGQLTLNDRTDLLDNSSGYGCAVMGHSWQLPQNKAAVVVPFDRQVGPAKNAAIDSSDQYHGQIRLTAGGLWRVDVMMSVAYRAYHDELRYYYTLPGGVPVFATHHIEEAIAPTYIVEVVDAAGGLITARAFEATTVVTSWDSGPYGPLPPERQQSSHFSHTFVLPPMPAADDPSAPSHWCSVRLSMAWKGPDASSWFWGANGSYVRCIGGTEKSGLYASRWSRDVDHINYAPTVPDGGTLS